MKRYLKEQELILKKLGYEAKDWDGRTKYLTYPLDRYGEIVATQMWSLGTLTLEWMPLDINSGASGNRLLNIPTPLIEEAHNLLLKLYKSNE
jgi:hypothetical protein